MTRSSTLAPNKYQPTENDRIKDTPPHQGCGFFTPVELQFILSRQVSQVNVQQDMAPAGP